MLAELVVVDDIFCLTALLSSFRISFVCQGLCCCNFSDFVLLVCNAVALLIR